MKEYPLIFDGESVRGIQDGRKTQTRRVVKPQPPEGTDAMRDVPGENRWWAAYSEENEFGVAYRPLGSDQQHEWRAPYAVGDRIWVRETWCPRQDYGTAYNRSTPADYKADVAPEFHADFRWRSPIHMPRWASRLTLEVTGLRVERLRDISEEDAKAEGIQRGSSSEVNLMGIHRALFKDRWDALNAKRGYPWADNPWVRVTELRKVEP